MHLNFTCKHSFGGACGDAHSPVTPAPSLAPARSGWENQTLTPNPSLNPFEMNAGFFPGIVSQFIRGYRSLTRLLREGLFDMMPYTVNVPDTCLRQHAPQTAPVLDPGLPCLSFPQFLSRHNITITPSPFVVRGRVPRTHPVSVKTGLKRIPKSLISCRRCWTLLNQNMFGIQAVRKFIMLS